LRADPHRDGGPVVKERLASSLFRSGSPARPSPTPSVTKVSTLPGISGTRLLCANSGLRGSTALSAFDAIPPSSRLLSPAAGRQ